MVATYAARAIQRPIGERETNPIGAKLSRPIAHEGESDTCRLAVQSNHQCAKASEVLRAKGCLKAGQVVVLAERITAHRNVASARPMVSDGSPRLEVFANNSS